MKRAIRKMVKCPQEKRFINWDTCAFHCDYSGSYDEFLGYILCNYKKEGKSVVTFP